MFESCGCQMRAGTHGHERNYAPSPELKAYRKMRERCLSANCKDFYNYGGRGITIDASWGTFEAFYRDMGPKPSTKHSIERLDVNGPYSKDNCVWATKLQQANNTRANRRIEYQGRTQTLAQWLREFNGSKSAFYKALNRGLSELEALLHAFSVGGFRG